MPRNVIGDVSQKMFIIELPDKNVTSDNTLLNERYQESTAPRIMFYTFNLHYEM